MLGCGDYGCPGRPREHLCPTCLGARRMPVVVCACGHVQEVVCVTCRGTVRIRLSLVPSPRRFLRKDHVPAVPLKRLGIRPLAEMFG